MTEIKSLIHQYYDLNKVYKDLIKEKTVSLEKLTMISDFYNHLIKSKVIDTIIKNDLTTDKSKEYKSFLNTLKTNLQENIALYTENANFLNTFDTSIIYEISVKELNTKIQIQLDNIEQYRVDFNEANKAFEATAFGNFNGKEIENRRLLYNNQKKEYKNQTKILEELFAKKKQIQKQIWQFNRNYFNHIHKISHSLSNELSKTETLYFDKGLIYSIYQICNKIIFESASEEDYQNSFNSLTETMTLKKAKGSRIYICYLIKFLSERVQNCDTDHWINETLNRFDINKKEVYDRKKNDVEKESRNQIESRHKKSKWFYNKINQITKIEDQISS